MNNFCAGDTVEIRTQWGKARAKIVDKLGNMFVLSTGDFVPEQSLSLIKRAESEE